MRFEAKLKRKKQERPRTTMSAVGYVMLGVAGASACALVAQMNGPYTQTIAYTVNRDAPEHTIVRSETSVHGTRASAQRAFLSTMSMVTHQQRERIAVERTLHHSAATLLSRLPQERARYDVPEQAKRPEDMRSWYGENGSDLLDKYLETRVVGRA